MAAFCRKKAMERNRSSRPSGHSRAQMKVEFIREKAFFSVLICGLLCYRGRLYFTYLKNRKLKKILRVGTDESMKHTGSSKLRNQGKRRYFNETTKEVRSRILVILPLSRGSKNERNCKKYTFAL